MLRILSINPFHFWGMQWVSQKAKELMFVDCILLASTQNLLTCGMRFPTAQSTLATSGSSCLQLLLLIFQQPVSVITWHSCLQKLAPSFLVVPQKDIVVGGFGGIPCFDIPVSKDHWIMDVQMCMNVRMCVYIQIRINMDRYFSIMYQFSRIIHIIYNGCCTDIYIFISLYI